MIDQYTKYRIVVLPEDHRPYISVYSQSPPPPELAQCYNRVDHELLHMRHFLDEDHYADWWESSIIDSVVTYAGVIKVRYYTKIIYFRRKTYGFIQTPVFEDMRLRYSWE